MHNALRCIVILSLTFETHNLGYSLRSGLFKKYEQNLQFQHGAWYVDNGVTSWNADTEIGSRDICTWFQFSWILDQTIKTIVETLKSHSSQHWQKTIHSIPDLCVFFLIYYYPFPTIPCLAKLNLISISSPIPVNTSSHI